MERRNTFSTGLKLDPTDPDPHILRQVYATDHRHHIYLKIIRKTRSQLNWLPMKRPKEKKTRKTKQKKNKEKKQKIN